MKWIEKEFAEKDRRNRSGFLFVPKGITYYDDNFDKMHTEYRWLEYAVWEEEYLVTKLGHGFWSARRWLDNKNKEK